MSKKVIQTSVLVFLTAALLTGCSEKNKGSVEINDDPAAVSEEITETECETSADIQTVTEISECTEIPETEYDPDKDALGYEADLCQKSYARVCEQCGLNYNYVQIESSDYLSDEQIKKYNSDLNVFYEDEVEGIVPHKCGERRYPVYFGIYTPHESWQNRKLNLWSSSDKEGFLSFYDPDTLEKLSWDDLLGENWQDYQTDGFCDEGIDKKSSDIHYYGFITNMPDKECMHVYLNGCTDDHKEVCIIADVPWENVNQKYLTEPEGWSGIREKIISNNDAG